MIYKLRNKNTGEIVSVEANSREEAALMVSQGSSGTNTPQPTQSPMEKFGNTLFGLGKNLASPFTRTFQRVGALGEETARAGTTNKAEGLMKEAQKRMMSGDNSGVEAMLDEAQKLSQGASRETTAQTNKSLTDPLQIAKDSAAMLSWGVPGGGGTKAASAFGKTLTPAMGMAGRGALSGAASGFGYSSETSAKGLVGSTALGGASGYVLGKLGEAREAKKFGPRSGTSRELRKNVIQPQVQVGPTSPMKEDQILQAADDFGLKGTPNQMKNQVQEIYLESGDEINKILKNSTSKKPFNEIVNEVTDAMLDKGSSFTDDPNQRKILNQQMKLLAKELTEGQIDVTAQGVYDFKNGLPVDKIFDKLERGTTLNGKEEVIADLWYSIDNILTGMEPGVKELTKIQSLAYRLSPGLDKAAREGIKFPLIGRSRVLTPIAQKLQGFLAGTPSKASSTTSIAPNLLEQGTKTPAIAGSLSSLFTQKPQQGQGIDTTAPTMQPSKPTIPTETGINITPQMMLEGYMTLPKEDIAILEKMYALQQETTKSTETAADKKRKAAISSAEIVYNQLSRAALDAPTGATGWLMATAGQIPGVAGGSAEDLKRVTEGYAKAIAVAFAGEVGVATDTDVARWLGLMPKPGDTKDERIRALARLKEQMDSEKARLGIE